MKKILFAFLVAVLAITLIACGGESETTETTDTTTPLVPIMVDTASDYTIVYPLLFNKDDFKGDALHHLEELIKDNAGGAIAVKSDYLADGDTASPNEILLGPTNRPESKKAKEGLRYDDYVIGFVDGKFVVVGGSDEASARAIRHFATMFFSQPQTNLVLRENFYERFDGDYAVNSLTFFGKDVQTAGIVYDSDAKADALYLQESILELTGYQLPLLKEGEQAPAYALTVLAKDATVSANDSAFILSHSDAITRSERVKGLIAKIKANSAVSDAALPTAGAGCEISVFDLNVYSQGVGDNSIANRYERLMTLLADKKYPDVLTLQDASPLWFTEFDKKGDGFKAMNEVYAYVGVGRNDDDDSVKNPVFYKKDRFTLVDSGTFWLSETPDWVSVGWDGRQRSVCTWVILEDKESHTRFAVMSTMLDSYGLKTRTNGMALLVERAAAFGCPVLLCGDMQAAASSAFIKNATEFRLFDAQKQSQNKDTYTQPTVNGAFGTDQKPNGKSDFIFASYGDFAVKSHTVDTTKPNGGYISNHWALYAEFSVKEYTAK